MVMYLSGEHFHLEQSRHNAHNADIQYHAFGVPLYIPKTPRWDRKQWNSHEHCSQFRKRVYTPLSTN